MPGSGVEAALVLLAGLQVLGLAGALGGLLNQRFLAPIPGAWAAAARVRLRGAAAACILIAFLACLPTLWCEAVEVSDQPWRDAGAAARELLRTTQFGRAWLLGLASLAIAMLGWWRSRQNPSPNIRRRADRMNHIANALLAAGFAGFAFARTLVSHAGAGEHFFRDAALDWLHLLFICAWVGEVLAASLVVLPSRHRPVDGTLDALVLFSGRLSNSAGWVLGGVLLTGATRTWLLLGALRAAPDSMYVRLLLVKLLMVGAAILLGAVNRYRGLPGLRHAGDAAAGNGGRADPARSFLRVLQVEALVLAGCVAIATLLASTAPEGPG